MTRIKATVAVMLLVMMAGGFGADSQRVSQQQLSSSRAHP
jgi:hypothetical protein